MRARVAELEQVLGASANYRGKARGVAAKTRDICEFLDEVGIRPSETVMNVPHDLVSKVRELIAKQHS